LNIYIVDYNYKNFRGECNNVRIPDNRGARMTGTTVPDHEVLKEIFEKRGRKRAFTPSKGTTQKEEFYTS
jgi:hypothetical protein